MSNDDSREATTIREAALYLYLAERFGWTPAEIDKTPLWVLSAMIRSTP